MVTYKIYKVNAPYAGLEKIVSYRFVFDFAVQSRPYVLSIVPHRMFPLM